MTRKYRRNTDGTFADGNIGKPRGSVHRVTRAVAEMLDGDAEAITRKAIDMALEGDAKALRLCLERIAPPRKDSPVEFDLPPFASAADTAEAARSVLAGVAAGSLSPLEGASIMGLIESYRRTLETTELEMRLKALEDRQ